MSPSAEESAATDRPSSDEGDKEQDKIPLLEWLTAAFGLALVLFCVAFLLYQAFSGKAEPPDVTFEVERVYDTRGGFLVEIHIFNRGATTAAGLQVEGSLREDDEVVETSELTLGYLPPHSEREAGLFFTRDPRGLELSLRAKGYQEP